MASGKKFMDFWKKGLMLGLFLLLCVFCALPAHAQATQNDYYYPGYDPAAHGEIDLMKYIRAITLTVNGQDYTPAELQEMKQNGTPLEMRVGDAASLNFGFSLCGRAYAATTRRSWTTALRSM